MSQPARVCSAPPPAIPCPPEQIVWQSTRSDGTEVITQLYILNQLARSRFSNFCDQQPVCPPRKTARPYAAEDTFNNPITARLEAFW